MKRMPLGTRFFVLGKGRKMDAHAKMILEEYDSNQECFAIMRDIALSEMKKFIGEIGMLVDVVESRIKTRKSLEGKLELKGWKYKTLADITDIVGARVVTFYSDEVDKIAAMVERTFDVDWENSIDKRKIYENDRFGYMSLHYVVKIPKSLYFDPERPMINEYSMEIQMRTTLQHAWATINHDTGYKSNVEIPKEYLRTFSKLSSLLELADDEFKRLRDDIDSYRKKVSGLIKDGCFGDLDLNIDTFLSYIGIGSFDKLNREIAGINKAEIQAVNLRNYLPALKEMGMKTLGDLENLKNEYYEDAFKLALHTYGKTDIDIIASSLALQNLCLVYIANNSEQPEAEMKKFYDRVSGIRVRNQRTAEKMLETITSLGLIRK